MARAGGTVADRETQDAETSASTPNETSASAPKRGGGNGPLERVTVNLTARSSRALQLASELTGDTKTDSINRSIQIYAYLEEVLSHGGAIYVRESADGEMERLKLF
jgi:hypothetical protein